jgi:hypothetical protein
MVTWSISGSADPMVYFQFSGPCQSQDLPVLLQLVFKEIGVHHVCQHVQLYRVFVKKKAIELIIYKKF